MEVSFTHVWTVIPSKTSSTSIAFFSMLSSMSAWLEGWIKSSWLTSAWRALCWATNIPLTLLIHFESSTRSCWLKMMVGSIGGEGTVKQNYNRCSCGCCWDGATRQTYESSNLSDRIRIRILKLSFNFCKLNKYPTTEWSCRETNFTMSKHHNRLNALHF